MRTRWSLFIYALLCVSTAYAASHLASETYIVAVRDDAPAQDVIFAADFSQSMKATLNVAFAGATQSEVEALLDQDSDGKRFIVLLDGAAEEATFLGSGSLSEARSVAREYLEDKGWDVLTEAPPTRERAEPPKPTSEEPVPVVVAPQAEEPAKEQQTAPPEPAVVDEPVVVLPPRVPTPQEVPPEEHGFFARIAAWFKGLFS